MDKPIGQNWLLLRGLSREAAHWGDFIPQLQAAFPDARINVLDLPGTGRHYQATSPKTIPAIAASVRSEALANGLLAQPVTLLALSLGAMVAWHWLQNHPDEVSGAALMNTSFADVSPFYQRLRWQSYRDFIALTMTRNIPQREAKILQLVSNRRQHDEQLILAWAKIQQQRPISLGNSLSQIMAAARFKPGSSKPSQPVLLLNGQGDRMVSPACSEALHKKWGLPLQSCAGAGHDLTLDDGAWVAGQLQAWVQAVNCR
ncbi:MAG: alpha/beta hydrolase [Methylococcales bacterium]|nr:alpha/beta hydrolase [Methylococcales bacterium]